MGRLTAVILLAGCFAFQAWAQTPQEQGTKEQAPAAEQKPSDPNHPSEQTPENSPAGTAASASSSQTAPSAPPWDRIQEFSALVVGGIMPGDERPTHIYRSGNLLRIEGIDQHSYWVVDLKTGEEHIVAARMCGKAPFVNSHAVPFSMTGPQYTFESAPVGEETIDGHLTRVEDVSIKVKSHDPLRLRLWEAQDLQGFSIKIEHERPGTLPPRSWTYEKVDVGPQDPTLFIYPENCAAWSGKKGISQLPRRQRRNRRENLSELRVPGYRGVFRPEHVHS